MCLYGPGVAAEELREEGGEAEEEEEEAKGKS